MSVGTIATPHDRPFGAWATHGLALAGVAAAILTLFARDAGAMAAIWWGSSSYEHCLLILPVVAWLVWLRRGALAVTTPRGWAPPLLWVAAGAAGWLVGEAAGVAAARHLGLVMMLQGAVAATLGATATRILAFPLAYALFLVPLGDALVPPLQTITAKMCMALLHATRVPATIDGVFITTPAGWFKVAEACSGAKFLIAMAALSVLVAHLGFRSWRRGAAFVALGLVVPVLANGVRAFATIWVAQHRGAQAADGFDHVVYGWFFFAAVIATVLAMAWRFFDRAPDAVPDAREVPARAIPLGMAAVATLAITAAAPAWGALAGAREATIAPAAYLPDIPGWIVAPNAILGWRPRFDGADRLLVRRYRDGEGHDADLAVALYARQGEGRELAASGPGAADPEGPWTWAADAPAPPGWRGERIERPGAARRAATLYVVDGRATASPARVKLATLAVRLGGGPPLAAAIVVSAADASSIDALVRSLGDPVALAAHVAAGD